MSELVESIESLINHLSPFFSEFAKNAEKMSLCCWKEEFPETFSQSSSYFESPNDHVEITIIY